MMNVIELIGYLGSFLVLVSFLMTSVKRLRIVNTLGSIIFAIYALIIKSYPTALMNICLVLINIHFLWQMNHHEKVYELLKVNNDDATLRYLLDKYAEDIEGLFPNLSYTLADLNACFLIMHEGAPVGITLGRIEDDTFDVALDYSVPSYRDCSIGKYLYSSLKDQGIRTVLYKGPSQEHGVYLAHMGFKKQKGGYIKNMGDAE